MRRWRGRMMQAMFGIAVGAAAVGAQQAPAGPVGTVVGQVVAGDSREPLIGPQILIVGSLLRATAVADGRFTVRNVPAGQHTVRVQFLGFAPKDTVVNVTAGGTTTLTIGLKDLPYQIAPVITTALGIAREAKSLGYATTSISS